MVAALTSAAGIISLLEEPEEDLKIYALRKLNDIVDTFWAEISDAIPQIESLAEDVDFKEHELASLLNSKVYYHLGEFQESLTYALGAGKLFDTNAKTEYVDAIISKCIDKYIADRILQREKPSENVQIDPRLEDVV